MKKLFILSALALGAMTMSAQIEYVTKVNGGIIITHSIEEEIYSSSKYGEFVYNFIDSLSTLNLYDSNFTVAKSILVPKYGTPREVSVNTLTKNLFTDDGKLCFVVHARYGNDGLGQGGYSKYWIVNEDGSVIKDFVEEFHYYSYTICFAFNGRNYIAIISEASPHSTTIYSLPNISTDINESPSPTRTSNVRKVVENGQMYIILDGVKYAVTGSTTL